MELPEQQNFRTTDINCQGKRDTGREDAVLSSGAGMDAQQAQWTCRQLRDDAPTSDIRSDKSEAAPTCFKELPGRYSLPLMNDQPAKSEWADWPCFPGKVWEPIWDTSSHATRQGTLGLSRRLLWTDPGLKVELVCASWSPLSEKKKKKHSRGLNRRIFRQKFWQARKKTVLKVSQAASVLMCESSPKGNESELLHESWNW